MILNMWIYFMLGADSRFWLANSRKVYTSLTFDVISVRYKDNLRNNDDHVDVSCAAMQLSSTVFIQWFRTDERHCWDFEAAETFLNVANIVWAWDRYPLFASLYIHT